MTGGYESMGSLGWGQTPHNKEKREHSVPNLTHIHKIRLTHTRTYTRTHPPTHIHGEKRKFQTVAPPTCMPQMRTPMAAEVVSLHFLIWRTRFSSLASSPCCRVPIFRSRIHGNSKCEARFSSRMNSSD